MGAVISAAGTGMFEIDFVFVKSGSGWTRALFRIRIWIQELNYELQEK